MPSERYFPGNIAKGRFGYPLAGQYVVYYPKRSERPNKYDRSLRYQIMRDAIKVFLKAFPTARLAAGMTAGREKATAELALVQFGAELPEYGALLPYLSPCRRRLIEDSPDEASLMRNIAAELSVCHALRRLGLGYMPPAYSRTCTGKPAAPDVYLSISHSGRAAVCAASRIPIGVDIERVRRINPGLARKLRCQAAAPAQELDALLLSHWVAKESFLKMTGEGLAGLTRAQYRPEDGVVFDSAKPCVRGYINAFKFLAANPPLEEPAAYLAAICSASPCAVSVTEYSSAREALALLSPPL